jgi:iron complex transport system permease protein
MATLPPAQRAAQAPERALPDVAAPAQAQLAPARVSWGWWLAAAVALAAAVVVGLAVGPVSIDPAGVAREIADRIPGVSIDSGLTPREATIVWDIRFPRVVLGLLVGAMLAVSGASYQGAFRNPLADPWLLGAAAGAGLGVTIAIIQTASGASTPGYVPLAAFGGALVAVVLTYALGASGSSGARLSPAALILAGVAVASFLTAAQTYIQQRHQDTIRQVYSWLLGSLSTAGWHEVRLVLPYAIGSTIVLLSQRRTLDVLSVGDEEAGSLGLNARRSRLIVVTAASLGTAAAVSVSGLIGFVGIIVPHTVRLLAGSSNRVIVPLSLLFGGAFLALADVVARMAQSPSEIPIGVVTAFFGAPFFVLVLRTSRRVTA